MLNKVDQEEIVYNYKSVPTAQDWVQINDYLYWMRFPLPFGLNHINLWMLKGNEGWSIIDFGINKQADKDIWIHFLNHHISEPFDKFLATHFHPDHVGLAGWLMEYTKQRPEFYMTQTEWLFARMLSTESDEQYKIRFGAFYRQAGLPENMVKEQIDSGNPYARNVTAIPSPFKRLQDQDIIEIADRSWRVIIGQGHAPEHISLYNEQDGILIAGDQILPKISPNISTWPHEPDANNLDLFLKSLEQFSDLPEDTLVLPSHGFPFYGLHGRIKQLKEHHMARLEKVLSFCKSQKKITVYDLMSHIFRPDLDKQQIFFAVGEAYAHLNYLLHEGRLTTSYIGLIQFFCYQEE